MSDILGNIREYFQDNPFYFGFVIIGLGIMLIVGVARNWDWVLEGDGRVFNLAWLSNVAGRKVARIACGLFGVLFIIIGVVWLIAF